MTEVLRTKPLLEPLLEVLIAICEVTYYNHMRALDLYAEGKVSEAFVSSCADGRKVARANLLAAIRGSSPASQGEGE